jgi:hypothetical protein
MQVGWQIRRELPAALFFNAECLARGASGRDIIASVHRTVKPKVHSYVGRVFRVLRSHVELVSQGLNVLYRQIVLYGGHHGACRDDLTPQRGKDDLRKEHVFECLVVTCL